ncbi:MAG: hypothetical protein KC910_23010, partial [Candidatus Eremiobacteraeota bacterium]|nr:hypothetical protein [Candidatus Eremiobacteraeota bacterium]
LKESTDLLSARAHDPLGDRARNRNQLVQSFQGQSEADRQQFLKAMGSAAPEDQKIALARLQNGVGSKSILDQREAVDRLVALDSKESWSALATASNLPVRAGWAMKEGGEKAAVAAAEAWKDASDRDRNVLAYGFQSQAAMGAVLDGNQAVGSAMSQALANNSVTPSSERLDALAQGTPEALWPLTEGKGELASQAMRSLARTEGGLSQAAERYDKLSPDARQALAEASLKNLDSETGQKLVETIARGDDMGAKSLLFKDYRNPQVLENDHLRGVLRDEALKTLETGKTNPATYWATNSVQSYSKTPEEARDSYNRLRAMAGQADKPQLAEKYNKMADDVARWGPDRALNSSGVEAAFDSGNMEGLAEANKAGFDYANSALSANGGSMTERLEQMRSDNPDRYNALVGQLQSRDPGSMPQELSDYVQQNQVFPVLAGEGGQLQPEQRSDLNKMWQGMDEKTRQATQSQLNQMTPEVRARTMQLMARSQQIKDNPNAAQQANQGAARDLLDDAREIPTEATTVSQMRDGRQYIQHASGAGFVVDRGEGGQVSHLEGNGYELTRTGATSWERKVGDKTEVWNGDVRANSEGKVTLVQPSGATETYGVDGSHTLQDENGKVIDRTTVDAYSDGTQVHRDKDGRALLTLAANPSEEGQAFGSTRAMGYDEAGQLNAVSLSDRDQTLNYARQDDGSWRRLGTDGKPVGESGRITMGENDSVIWTGANGTQTWTRDGQIQSHDTQNRITEQINARGEKSTYGYDQQGLNSVSSARFRAQRGPEGWTTQQRLTADGGWTNVRADQVRALADGTVQTDYRSPSGNLQQTMLTDGRRLSHLTRDSDPRDPQGRGLAQLYNSQGQLVAVRPPEGGTHAFVRDDKGEISQYVAGNGEHFTRGDKAPGGGYQWQSSFGTSFQGQLQLNSQDGLNINETPSVTFKTNRGTGISQVDRPAEVKSNHRQVETRNLASGDRTRETYANLRKPYGVSGHYVGKADGEHFPVKLGYKTEEELIRKDTVVDGKTTVERRIPHPPISTNGPERGKERYSDTWVVDKLDGENVTRQLRHPNGRMQDYPVTGPYGEKVNPPASDQPFDPVSSA